MKNIDEQQEIPKYCMVSPQPHPQVDVRYIRPKAAERKMKAAAGIGQTVWCRGESGVGKTSFVADYLKRRRYDYYSAQDINPEQISIPEKSAKVKIVVIDDLYGIMESEHQKVWVDCIKEMARREDIWLILISRANIPSWLCEVAIQSVFYQIEEEELLFTRGDMEQYFAVWEVERNEEIKNVVWSVSNAVPLWIRICIIEFQKESNIDLAISHAKEQICQYLNMHVYDQWDSEIGETLMKLAIVPSFDLDVAAILTGNSNVNILLQKATELGSFLKETNGVYTMGVPMRQSMIHRLQCNYGVDYMAKLYSKGGDALRVKGNPVEALKMYELAKDERSIAELLIQNARENPSSGYYYEMKKYYLQLPEEYIKQSVELMGAMSMLESLLMNVEESERWYEELKKSGKGQIGSRKKESENKILYLDIGLPHRGSSNLITILKNAGHLLLNRKAKLPEFSVTSNLPSMMNGGKDFCQWSKRDKELAASIGKIISVVLGKYGKGLISLALAESGLEKGIENYEVETLAVRGRMEAESGGKIEQEFVSVGILTWLSIFTGHMDHAEATMKGFCEKCSQEAISPQLRKNFRTLECRMALYQGKVSEVAEWMETASDEKVEFYVMDRFCYLTKVRVYLADSKYEDANLLLQQLEFYAQQMHRIYIEMEVTLLQAILLYRRGEEQWEERLQEVITQAESYSFVRLLSREGGALAPLLRKGNFIWKDKKFQKQVEQETTQMEERYPEYLNKTTKEGNLILSDNALKILTMQSLGKNTQEIADTLEISAATVKYHNKETYKKLGVKTKAQAIVQAKNRRLI